MQWRCNHDHCPRLFATEHAVIQHMNAVNHLKPTWECDHCVMAFWSEGECDDHMDHYGHHRWDCETCSGKFVSAQARDQHMDAKGHWTHYCTPCKQRFNSANNLKMHLQSGVHQGTPITCPFCKRGFVCATGIAHHLETGSCPNATNVNRQTIYNFVRTKDPNGLITKNLLEWHGDFTVTENSWNGDGYECYICHRVWDGLRGLSQHVNSDAHKQEIYHCPNKRGCGKSFKNLAGMFNHLESESCGFIKFAGVQQQVGNILTGNRLISF